MLARACLSTRLFVARVKIRILLRNNFVGGVARARARAGREREQVDALIFIRDQSGKIKRIIRARRGSSFFFSPAQKCRQRHVQPSAISRAMNILRRRFHRARARRDTSEISGTCLRYARAPRRFPTVRPVCRFIIAACRSRGCTELLLIAAELGTL